MDKDFSVFLPAIKDGQALGAAGLSVGMHILRIMSNRGDLSPNEVESIFSTLMETVDRLGSDALQGNAGANISGLMAEIRQNAKARWKGEGNPA